MLKDKITTNLVLQFLVGFSCEKGSEFSPMPHKQVLFIARGQEITYRKCKCLMRRQQDWLQLTSALFEHGLNCWLLVIDWDYKSQSVRLQSTMYGKIFRPNLNCMEAVLGQTIQFNSSNPSVLLNAQILRCKHQQDGF
jgi:hypothetical protein